MLGALLLVTGCEDTSTLSPEEKAEKKFKTIVTVVENGSTFAVKTYLSSVAADQKEKVTGYLNDASVVIGDAVTSGTIEPTLFNKYVTEKLSEKVPAPYDTAIISSLNLAISGYNNFYAANVKDKIENNEKAKQILLAIVAGIHSGVDPVSGDVLGDKDPLEGYSDWSL